jgi:hypothetical protein
MQQFDTQLLLFINHDLSNPVFDVLMRIVLQGYLLACIPYLPGPSGFRQQERRGMVRNYGNRNDLDRVPRRLSHGFVEDWMKSSCAGAAMQTLEGIRLILSAPSHTPCHRAMRSVLPSPHALLSYCTDQAGMAPIRLFSLR